MNMRIVQADFNNQTVDGAVRLNTPDVLQNNVHDGETIVLVDDEVYCTARAELRREGLVAILAQKPSTGCKAAP